MSTMMGPTLEIARIQSEINRLFESLFELKQIGDSAQPAWMPNMDIVDGPEALTLLVELPGVELGDFTLAADGGNIIIEGEKKPGRPPGEVAEHHCLERAHGPFRRVISLNYPINTHKAAAQYRDGVLKIMFPKVENRRGGAVPITVKEG